MKKAFLLLMAVAAVSAFAQEDWDANRRKAITFNPNPFIMGSMYGGFGVGGGFEYAFIPQISGKSQLYFVIFDPSRISSDIIGDQYISSLRFTLEGRWYPMEKSVHGLFANGGLQFQQLFGKFSLYERDWVSDIDPDKPGHEVLKPTSELNNNSTFGIYAGLGYKFIFGKSRSGLIIEPTLDYIWSANFGSFLAKLNNDSLYWQLGIQGVRFAVHIGASF